MTDVHMPDYVAYACRVFIEGHEGSVGCSPSGVMFNKFMTLLYRDVRRTLGVDIRLPHCWYRWGGGRGGSPRDVLPLMELRQSGCDQGHVHRGCCGIPG